jgi:hypothetical protein
MNTDLVFPVATDLLILVNGKTEPETEWGNDLADKGKRDKGKREEQKKSKQTLKEKRKQKKGKS